MITSRNSYYPEGSNSSWQIARRLSALAILVAAQVLAIGANLQFIRVLQGETLEFVGLCLGLAAIGLGLIVGARSWSLKIGAPQMALGAFVVIQGLSFYLFKDFLLEELAVVSSVKYLGLSYLFAVSPLMLVSFLTASIAGAHLRTTLNSKNLDSGLNSLLALLGGLTLGAVMVSFGAHWLAAPILLFLAGGALMALPTLSTLSTATASKNNSHNFNQNRIASLAFVGILAMGLIAQVLLRREERQSLMHFAAQQTKPVATNKLFWTFGPSLAADRNAQINSHAELELSAELLKAMYEDSLSVLLVDGDALQLDYISSLNCVEATFINSTVLGALSIEGAIYSALESSGNHFLQVEQGAAFDFLQIADRRWDVISLPGTLAASRVGSFRPTALETQEFYASCLTHLSKDGFVYFAADMDASPVSLFRRLTGFASVLRSRGVVDPSACFMSLVVPSDAASTSPTSSTSIVVIYSSPPVGGVAGTLESISARYAANFGGNSISELLACFGAGIESNLSDRFDSDLSHLTLARPFPGILHPGRLLFAPAVHAQGMMGLSQTNSAALFDALRAPVRELAAKSEATLITALIAAVLAFLMALVVGRKTFNHTMQARRHRQQRSFSLLALGFSGGLLIILPAIIEPGFLIGSVKFIPEQFRAALILASVSVGFWLTSRRQFRNSFVSEVSLILLLPIALLPIGLAYWTSGGYVTTTSPNYFLVVISLLVCPGIFGASCGALLRREQLLEAIDLGPLFSALVFAGLGALVLAKILMAAFGFGTTIELGIILIVMVGLLRVLQARSTKYSGLT